RDVKRVGRLRPDIGIELWHVARRPQIRDLLVEQQRGSAQYGIVAVAKQLRLAARRADADADNVGPFRRRVAERPPFLFVEIGLSMNEEFLGRLAMHLAIGREYQLEQVLRGVLLEMEIVVAGLPRPIRTAKDQPVALVQEHLGGTTGVPIGILW